MKKNMLLLIFVSLVLSVSGSSLCDVSGQSETNSTRASSDVLFNEENFPDPNFRKYLQDTYSDITADGIFTAEEISSIYQITVNELSISTLKGIEHFTALLTLQCYDNQLTSLDVSQNSSLILLWCNNNQLSSLDVSKNSYLLDLWCYNNQLSSLDVSKNTSLTEFECFGNQLSSLDVSKNTSLVRLGCSGNQLSSLDVSKNTSLAELWCNHNQLSSLDVSKNTSLVRLGCSGNQLSSLDVSKNTSLTMFECVDNQLSSLDVSKNTSLVRLGCSGNQLSSLDVSKNTSLAELWCDWNQLSSLDVSQNTSLEYLSCDNNQLSSLDVSKNTGLKEMYCYMNQIKDEGMETLVNGLPQGQVGEENWENVLCIVSTDSNEGNVCTADQVSTIRAKGWTPYCYNDILNETVEYTGAPTGIKDIPQMPKKHEGPVYDVRGKRLDKPRKGLNIIGKYKVVIK